MPVANEEATMAGLIEEILALPYDNLYLYPVVDDYSKDGTADIIRSYEDTGRVKLIYYRESRGEQGSNHLLSGGLQTCTCRRCREDNRDGRRRQSQAVGDTAIY